MSNPGPGEGRDFVLNLHFMIKASELRIGNFIQCQKVPNGPFEAVKITGVHWDGADWIEWIADDGYRVGMHKPLGYTGIPLTPDILEKCGSIIPYKDNRIQIGELSFFVQSDDVGAWYLNLSESAYQEAITFYKIRHLHQLQNLFFALTGDELEVKL